MNSLNHRWDTDILADLVAKKRDLLRELHRLAERQTEVVERAEMRELMTLLAAKQTLLNQVQRLERGLDYFRQQDPEQRRWRSADDRLACRAAADECEQLVAQLVAIEQRCESDMIRRRDEVAEQLQSAGTAANARAAYVNQQPPARGSFDIESDA